MPPKSSRDTRVLYWFRTDLRLHDSPALAKALALAPSAFFPVFCFDPSYVYNHRVGINRFRFLLESLQDLSEQIQEINPRSRLLLVRGQPQTRIRELCEKWQVSHVAFEEDHAGYSRTRDAEVRKSLEQAKVEVISAEGRHLYPVKEVIAKAANNKPPTSMGQYQKAISSLGDVAKPEEQPDSLPDATLPGGDKVDLAKLQQLIADLDAYAKKPGLPKLDLNSADLGGQRQAGKDGAVSTYDTVAAGKSSASKEEQEPFAVPTLASLGMQEPKVTLAAPIRGGTTEALRRLDKLTEDPKYLSTFAKPQTSPSTDPDAPSTTMLSPYIKFGCLGIRKLWYTVKDTKKKHKGGGQTDVPEGMEGQLLFRDMYAACEAAVGDNFERIRGNEICRYMDWYLPTHYDEQGNKIVPRPRGDDVSEARLQAFKLGQTGFPWIDALMRQLRHTGWIHHLGRHSVAAFLTRGQCWISWERGAEVFDEYLIDWDPSSNAGNWMWLSASAFFSAYYRCYGLATFPAKYDRHAHVVRKYCPELKDFPDRHIYAPHLAPMDVQKKAKCIIGQDYPWPILDEKEEKEKCMQRCKAAYAAKLYGTSKEVLQGTAEAKLRKMHGVEEPKAIDGKPRKDNKIPAWARAGAEANMGTNGKDDGGGGGVAAAAGAEGEDHDGDETDDDDIKPHETDQGHEHETEEEGDEAQAEEPGQKRKGGEKRESSNGGAKKQKRGH